MTTVLVVEDDPRLGALLVEYLAGHDLEVQLEPRGDRAVDRIGQVDPAVVVLDLMLPGLDGFEVFRQARAGGYRGRVMMLTARRSDADHVAGLELGADDFVTKPVDPRVLLARLQALLRRDAPPDPARAEVGALIVDRGLREVTVARRPVALTGAEFELLWLLARAVGDVIPRDRLFRRVRGIEYDGLDRTIDIHVSRLRKKLHDGGLDGDVVSVRGVGYQLVVRA